MSAPRRGARGRRPSEPESEEGFDASIALLVVVPMLFVGSVLASGLAGVDVSAVFGVWTLAGLLGLIAWRVWSVVGPAWRARAPRLRAAPPPGEAGSAEAGAPALRARAGATCPLCRLPVAAESTGVDPSASCAGCGTAYHVECLFELGGCSTLGCAAGRSTGHRA